MINMNPIMFRGLQSIQKTSKISSYTEPEYFKGEKEALMNIYNQYLKNMNSQMGGFREIDGKLVHISTFYHTDSEMLEFINNVRKRLEDLGAIESITKRNPQIIY